jgi:hypothetical protein
MHVRQPMKNALGPATAFHITTNLSFVIPRDIEANRDCIVQWVGSIENEP